MQTLFHRRSAALAGCLLLLAATVTAQSKNMRFTVSVKDTATHTFHVEGNYTNPGADTVVLTMPAWMPGYYQLLNYAQWVDNFKAFGTTGKAYPVQKAGEHAWRVACGKAKILRFSYDVKANRQFVANSYLDAERGYLSPAGMFMHPVGALRQPVTVVLQPLPGWTRVATGLDSVGGKNRYTYTAPDFDILYDCPILMGALEEFTPFTINGIRHRFIAFKPAATIDRAAFMADLEKLVLAGSNIIGHIPYKEYTFIGIGSGRGGIEHLNSTTISFDGKELSNTNGRQRTLSFIAHEYFHHYNVKRIRPVELGPFDYTRANRTNLLWVSEGVTVYYEYLMLRRAGLSTNEQLLGQLQGNLNAYEGGTGKLYQSLQQASYATWSDGPFGRTGDSIQKTISYYDKGPVIALLLDFAIRNASGNQRSLDDVMRHLYNHFYRGLQRGFTEAEFQQACEVAAGISLSDFFMYVYTVQPVDYNKYLGYAGLQLVAQVTGSKTIYTLQRVANPDAMQEAIFKGWSN